MRGKGKQVCDSYGEKDNTELMLTYGFLMDYNPFDTCELLQESFQDSFINENIWLFETEVEEGEEESLGCPPRNSTQQGQARLGQKILKRLRTSDGSLVVLFLGAMWAAVLTYGGLLLLQEEASVGEHGRGGTHGKQGQVWAKQSRSVEDQAGARGGRRAHLASEEVTRTPTKRQRQRVAEDGNRGVESSSSSSGGGGGGGLERLKSVRLRNSPSKERKKEG